LISRDLGASSVSSQNERRLETTRYRFQVWRLKISVFDCSSLQTWTRDPLVSWPAL